MIINKSAGIFKWKKYTYHHQHHWIAFFFFCSHCIVVFRILKFFFTNSIQKYIRFQVNFYCLFYHGSIDFIFFSNNHGSLIIGKFYLSVFFSILSATKSMNILPQFIFFVLIFIQFEMIISEKKTNTVNYLSLSYYLYWIHWIIIIMIEFQGFQTFNYNDFTFLFFQIFMFAK